MADWRKEAACLEADPEAFFPLDTSKEEAYEEARKFCDRCEVSNECLAEADQFETSAQHTFGMRAALTPGERIGLRRRRGRMAAKAGAL